MSNIKTKITSLVSEVTNHWNEAPKGRYMPYKEIISYAGGGIGVKFLAVMAVNMILSATNVLIGNTLGVEPIDVYILYFISVIVNIPLSGIRANIIDNTRSKEGKYRPYIVKMGIPSAVVTILFVWFPYSQFGALFGEGTVFGKSKAYVVTCAVILILNFFQNFFYYFFSEAYDNLIHVLSPNTQERADVATVKGVLYSLAPSVLNLAMPIFAQLFTNDNLYDIRLYRYIYPPLAIFSVALSIIVYVNTKEKIVQAKTHVIQIKFIDSLREVLKNKYFWVIALATWMGFLETSMTVVLGWLYSYGGICDGKTYSFITFICQNAGLVGMLLAPFAIRKWGKRVVLIGTNVLNIVFIALMFPVVKLINLSGQDVTFISTWMPLILLVLCYWMNNLMNAFMQILTPSINADIRDYQQYITGERIDGMFSTITAVGGLITVASSGIVNLLYDKFGINTETAQSVMSNPDVMNRVLQSGKTVGQIIDSTDTSSIAYFSLYDVDVLKTICGVLILASIAGAFINVLPYFFYDLTELKQQGMIRVLKIRAFFEDFGNNTLSDEDLVEVIEMVETSKELINEQTEKVTKNGIKEAKATKDENKIKQAKEEYKKAVERNLNIQLAPFVMNELNHYYSEIGRMKVADASAIVAEGLQGLSNHSVKDLKKELKEAKKLPKNTAEEKEIKKYKVNFCRARINARKCQAKYFNSQPITELPDDTKLNKLYNKSERLEEKESALYKELVTAKKEKNKAEADRINAEVKKIKETFKALNKEINQEQNKFLSYNRSAKPYLDAEKVLNQAENYTHFDELRERYQQVKLAYAGE